MHEVFHNKNEVYYFVPIPSNSEKVSKKPPFVTSHLFPVIRVCGYEG